MILWCVCLGQLPDTHPAALSFSLLNREDGEHNTGKLMGQVKNGEITHQLPSRAKQT